MIDQIVLIGGLILAGLAYGLGWKNRGGLEASKREKRRKTALKEREQARKEVRNDTNQELIDRLAGRRE